MRKIKFRGYSKRELITNTQWITDGYGATTIKYADGTSSAYLITPYGDYWVDENSVGQYTGLKDKNGKEIYEGDIVELKIKYWNNCNKEYVEYKREIIGEITDFRGLGWSVRYKEKDNNYDYPLMWLLNQDYTIEVKGNIFENME